MKKEIIGTFPKENLNDSQIIITNDFSDNFNVYEEIVLDTNGMLLYTTTVLLRTNNMDYMIKDFQDFKPIVVAFSINDKLYSVGENSDCEDLTITNRRILDCICELEYRILSLKPNIKKFEKIIKK